jgi:hypothetical protein
LFYPREFIKVPEQSTTCDLLISKYANNPVSFYLDDLLRELGEASGLLAA